MNQINNKINSIFLLPSLLTIGSLFCGYYAIIESFAGNFLNAGNSLFIALILDGLDGKIARITNTTTLFGAELDAFADIVSFGVAPAIVIFKWKLFLLGHLGWFIVFLYCACAGLRLARFNSRKSEDNNYFIGLPSPAASVLVVGFMYICSEFNLNNNFSINIMAFISIIASISMISTIRYYSFKNINFHKSGKFTVLLFLFFLLSLLIISPSAMIYSFFICYTLSAYILLLLKIFSKKNKVVKD